MTLSCILIDPSQDKNLITPSHYVCYLQDLVQARIRVHTNKYTILHTRAGNSHALTPDGTLTTVLFHHILRNACTHVNLHAHLQAFGMCNSLASPKQRLQLHFNDGTFHQRLEIFHFKPTIC